MSTNKFKNNKYFTGNYINNPKYKGWFCGAFFPHNHPAKTNLLEIKYAEHREGDIELPHYHKQMIEVLIFLEGKANYTVNNQQIELNGGDFLFVEKNNIISGEFLAPSKIFAIHTPSLPTDEIKL